MTRSSTHRPVTCLIGLVALLSAGAALPAAEPPHVVAWTVGEATREALVIPPRAAPAGRIPVVFVFHGHGGRMRAMARLGFQEHWPEALIVCPQGLPTATPRDPDGARSGWQPGPGFNGDRDLRFVDAMLVTLRDRYPIDDEQVFATGHSNGGGFTYLLGVQRADTFAAIAPSAAGSRGRQGAAGARALPVLHVSGERDPIVPFAGQKQTVETIRTANGCDAEGERWAEAGGLVGTLYPSASGTPVVWLVHPGGHEYPAAAPALIVRFFKERNVSPREGPSDDATGGSVESRRLPAGRVREEQGFSPTPQPARDGL